MSEAVFKNYEKNLIDLVELLGSLNTKSITLQNFPTSFLCT